MNVRNTSVGLVIVAVLSVALALWYLGHSTTRGHATAPSLQTEGGIAAAEATKKIDAKKPRIDQVAAGSTSVWSGAESYEAYERARNLNDLVNDLKAAAEGGDPTSQVVYAKALSECAMLSADPFYLDNVPIMNEQLKKNGRGIASTKLVNRYQLASMLTSTNLPDSHRRRKSRPLDHKPDLQSVLVNLALQRLRR